MNPRSRRAPWRPTEENGVPDATKSVTRQIEHARAYALTKGWAVASSRRDPGDRRGA